MRIIGRAAFLAMPEGVLFSKFSPHTFGPLTIKGNTVGDHDFYYQDLDTPIRASGSEEWADTLFSAMETGRSVELDLECESRDGLFDQDQLFAVWEAADVEALLNRLQRIRPALAPTVTQTVTQMEAPPKGRIV